MGLSLDEALDLLKRERANFLNYRRRVDDERRTEASRVRGQALEPLLPLLEELDRAFGEVPADLKSHPWTQGIALVRRRLQEALEALGFESVGRPGEPFDPQVHEAVIYEPSSEATEQMVSEVIRPGYRLGDLLLQPAKVVVRGPELVQGSPEATPEPGERDKELGG